MKYYNDKKEITSEEAHELKDKSNLIVSDNAISFKNEETKKKKGKK